MKIKKGDKVKVIAGKNKDATGTITKAFPGKRRVLIDGINVYKKHVRPRKQGQKGQVITVSRSIDASNIMLICASCDTQTKAGYIIVKGEKQRICKKCSKTI